MKKALTIGSVIVSTVTLALAQLPIGVQAQPNAVNTSAIETLIAKATNIVASLVPLLIGLALAGFFWFLVKFIWKGASDPNAKREALSGMGYSILALFLMVGIWGIIAFIANVFGIGLGGKMLFPSLF